jgi:hypothetical protein
MKEQDRNDRNGPQSIDIGPVFGMNARVGVVR